MQTDKLKQIPLAEIMGDEAKAAKAEIAKITESMDKLKAGMEVYVEALKEKK